MIFRNHSRTSQYGDITKHVFATITETWRLNCYGIKYALQFVQDQNTQCFAFNFISNQNNVLFTALCQFFQHRQEFLYARNLLISNQNRWLFIHSFLTTRISDKERTHPTLVQAKTFDNFSFQLQTLTGLNSNYAVFANFLDYASNQLSDFRISRRNRSNFSHAVRFAFNRLSQFIQFFNNFRASLLDAFPKFHRIMSSRNQSIRLFQNRICQHCYGRRAVACLLIQVLSGLLD